MWRRAGFASWNRLLSQMGPRWAGSGSEPRGPQPAPWPTAGPGGAGRRAGKGKSKSKAEGTALTALTLALTTAAPFAAELRIVPKRSRNVIVSGGGFFLVLSVRVSC
jgi:hypothetical protein